MTCTSQAFYWHPSGNSDIVDFAGQTKCSYLELVPHSDTSAAQFEGILDDASLGEWLEKDHPVCSVETGQEMPSKMPSSKLRLLTKESQTIIGTCGVNSATNVPEISFTKETFATIKDHFGLPDQYLKNIPSDHITRCTSFSWNKSGTKFLGLVFKLPFYRYDFRQLSISYNPKSNITYGLILTRNTSDALSPLLTRLELYSSNRDLSSHPLHLPILAIELEIERTNRRIHDRDKCMNDLEETMGQHEYKDRPIGNPLDMDFTAVTRKLNYISKRGGVDTLNLGLLMISLEIIASRSICANGESREELKWIEDTSCVEMNEKITWLKDTCRSLLLLTEYEERRTKTLIQVVYQSMAQKDAKVNINLAQSSAMIARASKDDSAVMREIAVETKRDSSAMKMIAVLGMIFLPGTFVAAIFAMPVFNWNGEQVTVINRGFGYYWAVAIPLTILVLVSWGVATLVPWQKWVSRKTRSDRLRERDTELTETGA